MPLALQALQVQQDQLVPLDRLDQPVPPAPQVILGHRGCLVPPVLQDHRVFRGYKVFKVPLV